MEIRVKIKYPQRKHFDSYPQSN